MGAFELQTVTPGNTNRPRQPDRRSIGDGRNFFLSHSRQHVHRCRWRRPRLHCDANRRRPAARLAHIQPGLAGVHRHATTPISASANSRHRQRRQRRNDSTIHADRSSNPPPVVANTIPDQNAAVGVPFTFTFAANTFTDPNSDPLTYTATKSEATPLPAWLTFNPARAHSPARPPLATSAHQQFALSPTMAKATRPSTISSLLSRIPSCHSAKILKAASTHV